MSFLYVPLPTKDYPNIKVCLLSYPLFDDNLLLCSTLMLLKINLSDDHEFVMIDTNSNTKTFVDSQELQNNRKIKSKVLN